MSNTGDSDEKDWLDVSTDASRITEVEKTAAQEEQDAVEALLTSLPVRNSLFWEERDLVARHRQKFVVRLKELTANQAVTDAGVGACLILCELRDEAGRSYAARVLRSGTAEQRCRILNGITAGSSGGEQDTQQRQFLFGDPQITSGLLKQLDDSDSNVLRAAIQTCGYLNVPGANERFLDLVKQPDVPDRGRLLFWLSKGELTAESFYVALKAANELPPDDNWAGIFFEACARTGPPAIKALARDHLKKKLASWPDDGKRGFNGSRISLLKTLTESASVEDLPWLRQTANQEAGYYARTPLIAWIRLDPEGGRKTLLKWLTDGERRSAAVAVASDAFAGSGDEEIVRALASAAAEAGERDLPGISNALDAIGGQHADRTIDGLLPRLGSSQAAYLQRRRNRVSLLSLLAAVEKARILDSETCKQVSEQLSQRPAGGDSQPPGLYDVFYAAGIAHTFDTETDSLPCHHDLLVYDLAKASRGVFTPRAVHETWHRRDEEDFDAPYTLQFIHGNRLYRGQLQNFGDWYDLARVLTMLNRALADANLKQRYVTLASSDQFATVVFADPAALAPLAERFHVLLSDDAEQAMKAGIEFENYAIERLKEAD